MKVTVRRGLPSDATDVARLTSQLGYDVEASALTTRLPRMLSRPEQRFLIADADGRVVGWLHAVVSECVEADAFVAISGLVVDRNHRRQGIGRALLEEAERWTREQGCSVIRLRSSSVRTDAHRFYEQLGYTKIKTQYAFAKSIDPTRSGDLARLVPRVVSVSARPRSCE